MRAEGQEPSRPRSSRNKGPKIKENCPCPVDSELQRVGTGSYPPLFPQGLEEHSGSVSAPAEGGGMIREVQSGWSGGTCKE